MRDGVLVVGRGFSWSISNFENKIEPLRIRNPPAAIGGLSVRIKGEVINFDILTGPPLSSFEGEEVAVEEVAVEEVAVEEVAVEEVAVEEVVFPPWSMTATAVLEGGLPRACSLHLEEAAVGDAEARGVGGFSLWFCNFWYPMGERDGDRDGDSGDVRTKCNGLFRSLISSSLVTLR